MLTQSLFAFVSKLGAFAATVRLDIRDPDMVPIWFGDAQFGTILTRHQWEKFIDGFFHAVSSHPVVNFHVYVNKHSPASTENVCFENFSLVEISDDLSEALSTIILDTNQSFWNFASASYNITEYHRIEFPPGTNHNQSQKAGIETLRSTWSNVPIDVVD
ncbi:hypothetical protein HDU89_003700 [Geranomyces variabilis]|nr:hypothetical protein HDU89_003700 [Geranomyces variabilis]